MLTVIEHESQMNSKIHVWFLLTKEQPRLFQLLLLKDCFSKNDSIGIRARIFWFNIFYGLI